MGPLIESFPMAMRWYNWVMTTVAEIKAAIEKLSLSERAELEKMLHGWEDDEWDRQMTADAKAGKLNKLLAKVDANIDTGNLRDLP